MENSFFEYRDKNTNSDSDVEVIDNSLVAEESFIKKKQSIKTNKTVFVAESEESDTNDTTDEDDIQQDLFEKLKESSVAQLKITSNTDDDTSERDSTRRQFGMSSNRKPLSSSDDEEGSPEMVPRRRPVTKKDLNDTTDTSFIGRKVKKRMYLIESDTDNSIVIEHNKQTKMACIKNTPAKIDIDSAGNKRTDSETESDGSATEGDGSATESDGSATEGDGSATESDGSATDDDGPDEDQMVMSRATRMSIMGVIPKENDSDDSDFIQSDDSGVKSRSSSLNVGSLGSTTELPDVDTLTNPIKTPQKPTEPEEDYDISRITCSPFSSPEHNTSNELNESTKKLSKRLEDKNENISISLIESPVLKENVSRSLKNKVQNRLSLVNKKVDKENVDVDDDNGDEVKIIDRTSEIIELSSDDEAELKEEKSPKIKKSPKAKIEVTSPQQSDDIKQYLVPPSAPNQVVYVKKQVRENELSKLNSLQEDLRNVRYLLENVDVNTLPDGGVKLVNRLSSLEQEVRRQGDKVANMVVEPDETEGDGYDKGLSWDEIQKASNAVQPRMFGKQAMSTHMAERNLILERLRDLHESLASRPPESQLAKQPAGVGTELMPHQLHALAWLRWRETQRPSGGILGDDMGLGKTITMISLIISDKESRIDDEDDDASEGNAKLVRGGTLVVCPASLLHQWSGELARHCAPHALALCLHHGAARAVLPQRLAAHDLVITTYNILERDNKKNGVLMRVLWHRVILDEAHIVRNHKAQVSAGVAALRGRRRWALTGTPVHNRDLDLYALLKFLRCTPFDDLPMWKKWIDNKSVGGQERLSTIMRCILLRRTKVQLQQRGQLACLPHKELHEVHVTLTKDELNVYQKLLVFSKTLFAQFLHQRAEKQSDAEGFLPPEKDTAYAKMHKKMMALQGAKPVKSHQILVLLLRLRQACCHCGLIETMLDNEDTGPLDEDRGSQDLLAELQKLNLDDSRSKRKSSSKEDNEPEESTTVAEAIRSIKSSGPVFDLNRLSSKIQAVMDCLNKNVFSTGDKAVVVSQWTSVLALVEREVRRARVRCVTLGGAVPVPARQPLVDALNDPRSDVKVMLLSLCAGGVGLNLCGANHLLLVDPHWNPQLEEQAQDRIYRVGQTKQVHIYKFICVDTMEQTIRKLQQSKLKLAEEVLTGARHTTASKLSIDDLKMLFNMAQ